MRKKWYELAALILIILLMAVIAMLTKREDSIAQSKKEAEYVRSSYRTLPEGYKALYETCRVLGYPMRRQIRPLTMLPKRGLLIVADPDDAPSQYEARQFKRWLKDGNYAIISLEYHTAFLGAVLDKKYTDRESSDGGGRLRKLKGKAVESSADAVTKSEITATVKSLRTRSAHRFSDKLKGNTFRPLYKDSKGIVAGFTPIGKGGVLWCVSPWSFSNGGIDKAQNLDLILALLRKQGGGPIIFDEFHHGYGAGMTVWDLAPTAMKIGLAQLAAALLLLFVTCAWRMGPYRLPSEDRFTRSRAEYLLSMAGLLHRAKATHVVRDRLVLQFRRELNRRLSLPAHATPAQIRAAFPAQAHARVESVIERMEALQEQTRPDEQALLRWAGDVQQLFRQKSK